MKPAHKNRNARLGALPPRYSFLLNPYPELRFTTRPRCNAKTRLRKISLVILIASERIFVLRKTCRLRVACETLIAHQHEIELLVRSFAGETVTPEYHVLGMTAWRRGLYGTSTLDDLLAHMSDFTEYLAVDYISSGWYRS